MKLLHFDSHIAGTKTLWILLFQKDEDVTASEKIKINFLIPTSFDPSEWLTISQKTRTDHLNATAHFQKLCEEATIKHHLSGSMANSAEKLEQIKEEIKSFNLLIKIFHEIMKRFKSGPDSKNTPPSEHH